MITAAVVALVLFILLTPLKVRLIYKDGEVSVRTGALFVMTRIFPKKKKRVKIKDYSARAIEKLEQKRMRAKAKAEAKAKSKDKDKKKKTELGEKKGGEKSPLDALKFYANMVKRIAKKFARHAEAYIREFNITVGTENAATTALVYGAVSQSAAYVMALLEENFSVKYRRDGVFGIEADFISKKTDAEIDITIKCRVIHIIGMVLEAFI